MEDHFTTELASNPDFAAFQRTIAESPVDPTPRLVFADWLEEHQETAWAEFIRLECKLDQLDPTDDQWMELQQRRVLLQRKHVKRWMRGLPAWVGRHKSELRLGLLDIARVRSVRGWLHEADRLFELAPTVRGVSVRRALDPPRERLADLINSPQMKRVLILDLAENHLSLETLEGLVNSPHLLNLKRLDLRFCVPAVYRYRDPLARRFGEHRVIWW